MQPKGVFCISLDFELHWGVFDKKHLPAYEGYFSKTRNLIPQLLQEFTQFGIHCTWATVGALACKNKDELEDALKEIAVSYHNAALDPRKVEMDLNENLDPFHFANSLIQKIRASEHQEIASHTFSHFYTLEPGSTLESFKKDLGFCIEVLQKPVSLVFPRNQYTDESLKAAKNGGIQIARSNPADWFWKTEAQSTETLWKKVFRTLDHYFPLGKRTSFALDQSSQSPGLPVLLPASRFLRPPSSLDKLLKGRKVKRIKKEMTRAAQNGEVYHLWWHPHNLAIDSEQSFNELNEILVHFKVLEKQYGFESLNMEEIACRIRESN